MCSALKYQKESYKFSAWDTVIITIGRIFLFIYGGFKVIQSQMTIGEFTIITTYFSMTLSAIRYFFSLGKKHSRYQCFIRAAKCSTGYSRGAYWGYLSKAGQTDQTQ